MEELTNKALGITESDIQQEIDLEILFNWKNQLKKQINKMEGKVEIAMNKDGIDNTSMRRAIKCQQILLEIIKDRITIVKQ